MSQSTKNKNDADLPFLNLRELNKGFGGVQALQSVSFEVLPGEVHALVGENGAGKSTLVKILAGAYTPDSGEIVINGRAYKELSPETSQAAGIAVVHQEFNLLPDLTVAENIFLGRLPTGSWGFVRPRKAEQLAAAILKRLGSDLGPTRYVGELAVVEQQLVEIAKALAADARCIILDEPSTVLAPDELTVLYDVLSRLREEGRSIVYISHRLTEVFQLSDRVTVMKDGRVVTSLDTATTTEDELIRLMVGRAISDLFPERKHSSGGPILEVEGLTVLDKLFDISLTLRKGEILGVAGLGGSGRTTLARAMVGLERVSSGRIELNGRDAPGNPGACARAGLVMVPEDRKAHGIHATLSVMDNLSLPSLKQFSRMGFLSFGKQLESAKKLMKQFGVRPETPSTGIVNLSGGNQQKVVLAKWFATSPIVVVLDEPTRGVDVGAKSEIYAIIEELSASGVGVLMASSDLPELIGTCDRIIVLREGRIAATINRQEASEEAILRAAVGTSGAVESDDEASLSIGETRDS